MAPITTVVTGPADVPRKLGRYTLLRRIASGGMASVYLGRLTGPDGFQKPVAVKIIHEHLAEHAELVQMFVDEARLVSRVNHPNVVQVIDLDRAGGTYFIVMEYVEGESVSELLRHTFPPVFCSARIVAKAAAGLHAVHEMTDEQGQPLEVVHRDVSPRNVLISYEGTVKISDFGIAHARKYTDAKPDGCVRGTFSHMAPEQVASEPTDRRADIFSLGIMLYELTTHRPLFHARTEAESARNVLKCDIVPPTHIVADYPKQLEEIVMCALQRDPNARFQTALNMQKALGAFIFSQSTDPMPPEAVGQLMQQVFFENMVKKRQMLQECWKSPGTGRNYRSVRQQRKRNIVAMMITAIVAMIVLGVLVVHRVKKAPSETITVNIAATPPNAKISIDGQDVTNPYRLRRFKGEDFAVAAISAAGYVARQIIVPLYESSSHSVKLFPELPLEAKRAERYHKEDNRPRYDRGKDRIRRPQGIYPATKARHENSAEVR